MCFLLGLLLCCGTIRAQEHFFAFVNNQDGKLATDKTLDHKLAVAQSVFKTLVDGQGDFRRQRPTLVMADSEMYIAWAHPERAEIGLEELAYDICASFGPDSLNALAALLTHELVHYYEKHEWSRHFAKENEELSTAQQLKKLEEGLKLEAQADYLGGFLASSVGFDVHGVMPKLLQELYSEKAYDLPAEIEGYPSLDDRIAMSKKAMDQLYELQIVSQTASYLSLLENYTAADHYYRYILTDFQSRGIYNNAGVNALLSALQLFTKKEMPFALPIELDPKTRLQKATTRDPDLERQLQREQFIKTAQAYFNRALALDQNYGVAFFNKAVCHIFLEEWDDANYWMRKARKENLGPKMTGDLQVLKGVVAALQNREAEASQWWQKAEAEAQNYLATINLEILKAGFLESEEAPLGFAPKREQINGLDLDEFLQETAPDRMVTISKETICGFYEKEAAAIYSHSLNYGQSFISVQVIDDSFDGTTADGIKIGNDRQNLLQIYGKPPRQVQMPSGTYFVYPKRRLFFQLDAMAKVIGWGVYRVK